MSDITKKYTGVVIPMVSPFHRDFSVDTESAKMIASKITDAGAAPFLLGSTGEGPSMSISQKEVLLKTVVGAVKGRSLIYAGLTSNSFVSAIAEANSFVGTGVDVLVATLPYYYPIDEKQMIQFFEKLADASPLPLILYNMPGMVKRSIPLELANSLSNHPNIVGMKDSERDENRLTESISLWKSRNDFSFLIGWAAMSSVGLQLGADGIVPSTGNFCPDLFYALYKAILNADIEKANHLQELTNKVSVLYQQGRDLSHSIPALKTMMEIKNLCSSTVLPPMYSMDEGDKENYIEQVKNELKQLNI